MTLEMALEELPLRVRTAVSAESALEQMAVEMPDILVTDKNLPGISGVELLRRARALANPPWGFLITGYGSAQSAAEVLNLGVYGYFEKPFADVYAVAKRIDDVARLKASADQRKQRDAGQLATEKRVISAAIASANSSELRWIADHLSTLGAEAVPVSSMDEALALSGQVELWVVDAALFGAALLDVVRQLRQRNPACSLVIIYDRPSLRTVSALIDLGGVKLLLERPLTVEVATARLSWALRTVRTELSAAEVRG